jgi:nitrate reductase gamma subunit
MEPWITFAKRPLFAFAFLVMILGLARLVTIQVYSLAERKRGRLHNVPWRKMLAETARWALPVQHLIPGSRIFSTLSYVAHIGILLVPIFLADHVVLWERFFGVHLPKIGHGVADPLTLVTIACLLGLLGFRTLSWRLRALSQRSDFVLLVAVLLPFTTGYMAMHPRYNPLSWDAMMLTHLLSGELLLVLIPFTKLAHVVLFFFDRVSSGLHWKLRPGAGDKVAEALFGKEARV